RRNPPHPGNRLKQVATSHTRLPSPMSSGVPMTRHKRLVALGVSLPCVAAGVALVLTYSNAQPPRVDLWKQVADADAKGLPRTGIKAAEQIIDSAMKGRAYPEAIKAIAKKINLEGNIEGNKPEEKITRMKAAIEAVPAGARAEMHPVMTAILAHWYWHYFQQNRWRFVQRTQTGVSPGDDIQTWDLPRIFAEIDKTFEKALSAEKDLKATPVA